MKRPAAHYFACLLGGPAGVALLGGATAYAIHRWAAMPDLAERLLAMAAGTLALGYVAFRPIAAYLATPGSAAPPAARFHRLPLYSALWTAALAALALASHLASVHGAWADAGTYGVLGAMLIHLLLFAAYIGLLVYFLVGEFVTSLRIHLWSSRRAIIPAGRGSLALRVLIGFAAAAAAPFLLVLGEPPSGSSLALARDSAMHHHASLRQLLQMDLLAAGLFTAMLVYLGVRAVSRPVRSLVEAMERVDHGELETQAAVVSDDELGHLTARFNRMLEALRERERIRRLFGRFVPDVIAARLMTEETLAPHEREASVLYADVEGFTTIASSLAPPDILVMLNELFEEVGRIISSHGGVITQFQGDAVLAGFNLPAALADHANQALKAAVAICTRLDEAPFGRAVRMRVGIATGHIVGGTVGGGDRIGYTLHGDTVNLAARLEELNKRLGTRVLIDDRTAQLLEGGWQLRDHGVISVRGLSATVQVFEPHAPAPQAQQCTVG